MIFSPYLGLTLKKMRELEPRTKKNREMVETETDKKSTNNQKEKSEEVDAPLVFVETM